ncbi:hypothetical protein GCM10009665_55030 [Kitasatospora nipponensis]|uniref:Uncharacterized protein n=1 Tax=Kitasatospora nipponensis TaxID=258049 RepID=A0ABN1WS81_9ACTN
MTASTTSSAVAVSAARIAVTVVSSRTSSLALRMAWLMVLFPANNSVDQIYVLWSGLYALRRSKLGV